MRHLLEVRRGNNIPIENDISTLIPDVKTYYEQTISSWKKMLQLEQSSMCVCDPYFAGSSMCQNNRPNNKVPVNNMPYPSSFGTFADTFGGYANQIHADLNHKCYPYDTAYNYDSGNKPTIDSTIPQNDGSMEWFKNMSESLFNNCTNVIINSLIRALFVKGYERHQNMDALYKVFKVILSAMEKHPNLIQGIYSVDSLNARCWNTSIVIQIADVTSLIASVLRNALGELNVPLSLKVGSKSEVAKLLSSGGIVNWAFGTVVENETPVFVFSKYRMQESNQYKVCVTTSNNLRINIPSGVTMVMDAGSKLTLDVYPQNGYIPSSITIGEMKYMLSTYGLYQLSEKGITIMENELSSSVCTNSPTKYYTIVIDSISEHMNIHIDEMIVSYLSDAFAIRIDPVPKLEPVYVNCLNDIVTGKILFQFAGNTQLFRNDRVKTYAVPMLSYNDPELSVENSCFSEIKQASLGFGEDTYYELSFSAPWSVVYDGSLLIRVVFDEGAISSSRLNDSRIIMGALNEKFAVQFELDINSNLVRSTYCNRLVPTTSWVPTIPSEVIMHALSLSNADVYPYFTISPNDAVERGYLLTKTHSFDGNIPMGIPESSIYSIVQRYYGSGYDCKQCVSVDTSLVDTTSFYFATIAVPIGFVLPNRHKYQLGDTVNIPRLIVHSSVLGAFNIDCRTMGYYNPYPITDGKSGCLVDGVMYIDATRPYLNGYVDIPVAFSGEDTIVIDLPDFDLTFTISVQLPEQEPDDNDNPDVGDIENPDLGENADTPIEDTENPDTNLNDETDDGNTSTGDDTSNGDETSTNMPDVENPEGDTVVDDSETPTE